MNKKDIQLLSEAYVEEKEALPDGEIGALAQTGVEELEEPYIQEDEFPRSTNIFSIISRLEKGDVAKKLGFVKMVDFRGASDGMVAIFEHKDGNHYEIKIRPVR